MFWIKISDPDLFFNSKFLKHDDLKNISLSQNILICPTLEEINANLKNSKNFTIVHYLEPEDYNLKNMDFFTLIDLKSKYYPFTKEQIENTINKEDILADKLGLRIIEPKVTLDDMAGADILKEDIEDMLMLEDLGLMNISGLFLFGVAGAGKSYFAECFAGSTGRIFVVLDLPYFMSLKSPTKAIDDVFNFLLSQKNNKYLLFIDEIEKMFDFGSGGQNLISDNVLGKMLTWLNEIYQLKDNNLAFVATANRIETLLENKPEFVRKGRFDRLYFLDYPDIYSSAPKIFDMYYKKEIKKVNNIDIKKFEIILNKISEEELRRYLKMEGLFNIDRIIKIIEGKMGNKKVTNKDRFIYTPPEIKSIVSSIIHLHIVEILRNLQIKKSDVIIQKIKDNEYLVSIEDILEKVVWKAPPLQITAKEGIIKQIAQAKSIAQGDKIAPFINV